MNITQDQFIHDYNNRHREQFNPLFFERSNQEIMDDVKKVIKSCEKDRYFTLEVLETNEIYNYEAIYNMLRTYEAGRRKKNSKIPNKYDYIDIKDSDIMLLEVKYFIRHNGTEKSETPDGTNDVKDPQQTIQVLIALPRFMHKYYFRLNGNYYTSTFQIVDGSTYNNAATNNGPVRKAECNTFKTLFAPVRIYKHYRDMTDYSTKSKIKNIIYGSNIFNTYVDCMYYILANYGIYGTMDFLDIHCVYVCAEPINNPDWFSFQKHNVFICYPKFCAQDPMIQSFAATLWDAVTKDTVANDLFNPRFWVRNLGTAYKSANSMDKGLFVLDSIDGIYDIITREELHLPEDIKQNIYQILRWLMREFEYINQKNNVDVTLKRIRIAEYIAAVYAAKLSTGIRRACDLGKRVTLWTVIKAIKTDPMYVINKLMGTKMSNLVSYRDMVNDNDATVALKYTYKGISGLGEDGTSIQRQYRYVDPSHAGIIDLDASSASDPGMSGMICPMANIYNNSFTQYQEPNYWESQYKPIQTEWDKKCELKEAITVPEELKSNTDYLNNRDNIIKENLDIDNIVCPIYNIHDESIDYSSKKDSINNIQEPSEDEQSLFDIKDHPDDEDNNNVIEINNDEYESEDDFYGRND